MFLPGESGSKQRGVVSLLGLRSGGDRASQVFMSLTLLTAVRLGRREHGDPQRRRFPLGGGGGCPEAIRNPAITATCAAHWGLRVGFSAALHGVPFSSSVPAAEGGQMRVDVCGTRIRNALPGDGVEGEWIRLVPRRWKLSVRELAVWARAR